jgi:hypothetical protein
MGVRSADDLPTVVPTLTHEKACALVRRYEDEFLEYVVESQEAYEAMLAWVAARGE